MNGPRRLLEQPGPSARLLRAADTHVPSERARRRALLAAGSAAATVAASGSATALGGGALLKSALVWLSAGVLGGVVIAVSATSGAPSESTLLSQSALASRSAAAIMRTRGPAASPVASSPSIERVEPVPTDSNDLPPPAGMDSALESTGHELPSHAATRAAANAPSLPRVAGNAPSSPNLYDELRLIDGARSAAVDRDPGAVLALLDRYDRAYPHGQFVPEALALRIETLARAGNRSQAQALATRFQRDYPQHPLVGRVGAALGD
jgi:hypothetical protein